MANSGNKRVGLADSVMGARLTWILVALVPITGFIATISLAYVTSRLDFHERWRRADKVLEGNAIKLQAAMATIGSIDHITTAFFAASRKVEPDEFSVFALPSVKKHADLQAVLFVLESAPDQRANHLRMAAARGLDSYRVHDILGMRVDANTLAYPTWFAATEILGTETFLGFDWRSIPPARRTLELARDTGELVASGSLAPWLERDGQPLTILAAPVYGKSLPTDSVEERRAAVLGYVVAVQWPTRLLEYLETSSQSDKTFASLYLVDVTDAEWPQHLARSPAGSDRIESEQLRSVVAAKSNHLVDLAVAGRRWRLVGVPEDGAGWSFGVYSWLFGGLLVSLLLASVIWLAFSHISKVEMARLQALSDSVADGIVIAGHDGRIYSFNRAAEEMFGRSAEETVGLPLTSLMPERLRDNLAEYLATGETTTLRGPVEFSALRADGNEFPIELSVGTWRAPGNIVSFAAIMRDNTRRRKMEKELVAAKEMAEAASRAKSEFLAKMSHELRTPLNAIVGLSDLLGDTQLTRSQRADLEQISRSADMLLRLVSDILDLSRIEAGQLELALAPISLRTVIEDSVKPLVRRAQIKGLELSTRVAPEVPDALIGDAGRLQQILINLVGNAVKFTVAGEIQVEVHLSRRPNDHAEIECLVRDTGPGIPADQREEIFKLFAQGELGARHAEGVGLGLATATQLVQMMGGKLWVESEVGRGSTFHFTVTLAIDEDRDKHPRGPKQLAGTRILIVDDNSLSRQSLTEITQSWGMRATAVGDGEAGMAALLTAAQQGSAFSLALLDFDLPDTDGIELARRINEEASLPPLVLVLMSTAPDGKAQAAAKAAGFASRFEKPVSRSDLLDVLDHALGLPSAPRNDAPVDRRIRAPLKVLLAEDNPINEAVTRRMLVSLGHQVESVGDGRAAVEAVARQPFDIVLMDYDMPVMDGLEATKIIRARERERGQHLPIIALTAYALQEDRERLLEAGLDDVLTKPVRMVALDAALDGLLGPEKLEAPETAAPDAELSPAQAPSKGAVIDIEKLVQESGRELIVDLIEMLERQLPELDTQISIAIEEEDADRLRLAAHTLKGSLALFGASSASEAAKRLEELGRSASFDGTEDALVELRQRLAQVRDVLGPIKQKLIAAREPVTTKNAPAAR